MATNPLTNGTKQYILNYDGKYMYPYTLLSCIIDDDDPTKTGSDVVIDQIVKQIKPADKTATGEILGALSGDSNALSLVKLGSFNKTVTENEYKYFNAKGEFKDLPSYEFSGINVKLTPQNNVIKFNTGYFEYSDDDGLVVKGAKRFSTDVDTTANAKKLHYFHEGAVTIFSENIGTDKSIVYYTSDEGFKKSSARVGSSGTAMWLNNGSFEQIESSNLIAGKLFVEDNNSVDATKCAVPYIYKDNTIKYIQPVSNIDEKTKLILTYKQDETGDHSLSWETPGTLNGTTVVAPDETDTTTAYYLLGAPNAGDNPSITYAKTEAKGLYFKGLTLFNTSDARLKTFTDDISIDFDALANIKKGIFYWNDDPKQELQIGVTAQTVKSVYPQLVSEKDGVYSVSYDKLSVIALAAIDKLHEENESLKKKILELEKRIK